MTDADTNNPLTHPALRTCGTCGCAAEVGNPQDVSQKALVCQYSPPRVQDQRVRLPAPDNPKRTIEAVQRNIFHMPTTPEARCFRGWCPKGSAPGDNWQLHAYMASMGPLLEAALKGGAPVFVNSSPDDLNG